VLGAEIWKKTSPLPEDAVFAGMLSLKHTFVAGQTLATWAKAPLTEYCQCEWLKELSQDSLRASRPDDSTVLEVTFMVFMWWNRGSNVQRRDGPDVGVLDL
jgi:hypothetical protein